ncbi:flagellar hook-length control protein FliK [Paucimonas lemoignei]|uniref:Flagellar hook-length control protein FliK n=2 Tax=Paucimonas lemoignei TaxID=29443 RepID=A0A4R3HX22_PAULE|nr:flagellar hook-length control protein FliK [Paucimonas lemoignei]
MIPPLSQLAHGKLSSAPDIDPAKNLQLGQILLAKVLRVHQNGSYLVDLNGHQHIVDSAIPLRQGEVFRGKIISLDERIVLEKMVDAGTAEAEAEAAQLAMQIDWSKSNLENDLKAFLTQHQNIFDVRTWNALIRAAGRTSHPQLVLTASVFLHKLGVPVTTELAVDLAKYLENDARLHASVKGDVLHLQADFAEVNLLAKDDSVLQLLAAYIQEKSEKTLDHARTAIIDTIAKQKTPQAAAAVQTVTQESEEDSGGSLNQSVLQWLMNVQTGGAIAHRTMVVPFVVDGKLVELEMALFDQKDRADMPSELRSRVIRLTLKMEYLGKIDAVIKVVNQNLQVQFLSDSDTGMQSLAAHNHHLKGELEQLNYRVDELRYHAEPSPVWQNIMRPVVDMVVNTDSLSMLV